MTSFLRFKSDQEDRVERERRSILMAGATLEQFKSRKWPVGSSWFWAVGVVGPMNSAVQPDKRSGE